LINFDKFDKLVYALIKIIIIIIIKL